MAVARASSTPVTKSRGVVSVLAAPMRPLVSSTTATSVNVPPISTPIRQAMRIVSLPVVPPSLAKSLLEQHALDGAAEIAVAVGETGGRNADRIRAGPRFRRRAGSILRPA